MKSANWPNAEVLAQVLPTREDVTIHVLQADEVDAFVADLRRWYGPLAATSEAQMFDPAFFYQHAIASPDAEPSLLVLIARVDGVRSAVTMLELDPVFDGLLGRFCAVDPACRGCGLASLLVEAQIAIARVMGTPHTHALTELNNRAAGNAFVRHQFDVVAFFAASETKSVQGSVRYVHEVLFLHSLRDGRLKQPVPALLHPATAALYENRLGIDKTPAMAKDPPLQSFAPATSCWPNEMALPARWLHNGESLPEQAFHWTGWAISRTVPSLREWLIRVAKTIDTDQSHDRPDHTLVWLDNEQVVGLLGLGRDPTCEVLSIYIAATAPGYEATALPLLKQLAPIAASIGVRRVHLLTTLDDVYHQEAAESAGFRVRGLLPADEAGELHVLQVLSLVSPEILYIPPIETMLPEVARVVAGIV